MASLPAVSVADQGLAAFVGDEQNGRPGEQKEPVPQRKGRHAKEALEQWRIE